MIYFAKVFPENTYRKLVASLIFNYFFRGRSLFSRLTYQNFVNFLEYSGIDFRCNVCGNHSKTFYDFPDLKIRKEHGIGVLRETLQCRKCGATTRNRSLAAAILKEIILRFPSSKLESIKDLKENSIFGLSILDTDAHSPIARILKGSPNYYMSSYVPEFPLNINLDEFTYNLNLEKVGLNDESFDIILTSDVAEHIRDIDSAHGEIFRLLRKGGVYIFNVPYDEMSDSHHVLVDTSTDEDIFLVPPQIHGGDPVSCKGGALAYRIFGKRIFDDFSKSGFSLEYFEIDDKLVQILRGDVFVAKKK